MIWWYLFIHFELAFVLADVASKISRLLLMPWDAEIFDSSSLFYSAICRNLFSLLLGKIKILCWCFYKFMCSRMKYLKLRRIPYKAGYCAYEEVLRTKWQDVFWCKYNFRQVFWLVCYFYSSGFRLFLTTSASNSVVVRLLSGESLWYIKFSI